MNLNINKDLKRGSAEEVKEIWVTLWADLRVCLETRVSTGIPGYGLRMEMIRKFFSISIMEKVPEIRNSGTIFFRKPEISGTFLILFLEIIVPMEPG